MSFQISVCRSCGARIVWALSAKGNRIPIDAEATGAGLVLVETGGTPLARVADLFEANRPKHMPHHATCPDGKQWRRPK